MRRLSFVIPALVTAWSTLGSSSSPALLPDALVSRQLFEREHLSVGETVELSRSASGGAAKHFRIAGVYEPTPDPMRFAQERLELRVHLPDAEGLAASGPPGVPVTGINVQLRDAADAAGFASDVERRLPGVTARSTSASDDRVATFTVLDRFHLAIAIVTLLGSGAFLLALMVMLVDERRETVATLRLIGLTRARLVTQILIEGALIAGAGAAFGIVFAAAAEPAFNRFFQWRYDTALVFVRVTPAIAIRSVAFAVPVGLAASAVAGWTVLRRRTLLQVGR
ncbi:MAG TPA: FtsX-like permease family protein [Vicinamibacterales bacterium]|jgi:ABC-type lipoprotein release transport system permease subunit|nr:FtsX-like permease family protein [Vicinamibacterales bacterium]